VDETTVEQGFSEPGSLAMAEYRETLATVVGGTDKVRNAVRVGRLVGVVLKEPFAVSYALEQPSNRTAAYRGWRLVNEDEFKKPSRTGTWQHRVLDEMRSELAAEQPYLAKFTTYEIARDAQYETGFFGYFARTVRKYICGDKAIRKQVDLALKESSKTGVKLPALTPEAIVGGGGLTLGVYLVQSIPVMGMVGAPVVAGIVVILYRLGIEAFCEWSAQLRTDEEEKE
jgi:hypothetical protein